MRRCLWLLALTNLVFACDNPPPPPPRDTGPRDAAIPDGGPRDASRDARATDVGATADGGDGGATCTATVETLANDPVMIMQRVAIAGGTDSFAIAWALSADTGFREVFTQIVPTRGALGTSRRNFSQRSLAQAPSLVQTSSGWLIAWFANPMANYDIFGAALAPDGTPMGAPVRWSMSSFGDDRPIVGGGASPLALWFGDGPRALISQPVRADASLAGGSTVLATGAGLPASFSLDRSGPITMASWTIASDALAVALDETGHPLSTPNVVSTEHNAEGTTDLAVDDTGAVVVFGVVAGSTPQVRAATLEADATIAMGTAESIINPIGTVAAGGSVARLGPGYVVSYRVIAGASARVEAAFVDSTLHVVARQDLGPASDMGQTMVRVASDGRIGVVWADLDGAGTTIRLGRIDCP